MKTGTSTRRLVTITNCILTVVFGGWCLLWYASAGLSLSSPEGVYQFLAVGFVGLTSGIAALVVARSRWRWLLLMLLLPVSLASCERAWELWSWSYHSGVVPYFLFLIPSALVSIALWAFTRHFTRTWPLPMSLFSFQRIAAAILHALPFALVFAPTWLTKDDFNFLIPASSFLFIPGFGGIFGGAPSDSRGILIASASIGTFWLMIALMFLLRRPQRLTQEVPND